jgi:hypothetical protein
MTDRRRVVLTARGNEQAEVLMVPWDPQHDADSLCFPSSVWMVYRYFADHHSNDAVRTALPPLTYSAMVDTCLAGNENGTRIGPDLVRRLTERLVILRATLVTGYSLGEAQARVGRGLPSILIYEGSYVLQGIRGSAHAGVYIGQTTSGDPILNNPWVGALFAPQQQRFLDGWDLRARRAILLDPIATRTLESG